MAMQNQTSMLLMGSSPATLSQDDFSQDLLSQDTLSQVGDEQNPCPHHESTINGLSSLSGVHSANTCECPDCSNCKCNIVSSTGSLLLPSGQPNNPSRDISQDSVFIASVFPDSPNTSILRPPIT